MVKNRIGPADAMGYAHAMNPLRRSAFLATVSLLFGESLAAQDLHAFREFPPAGVRLVGEEGHHMVPETDEVSQWTFEGGVLTASPAWDSVVTPEAYGDFRMHVEFRVNDVDNEKRETNGNSGVYIQQRYELQILDSHGISAADYQAWDCGSLYRLKEPDQIASLPAEAWQSYDIVFRAARFEGEQKVEDARVTVFHNDLLIHDNVALARKTGAGQPEGPEPRPIKLQGHHNQVGFRNVWIEALNLAAMPKLPADDPRRAVKVLPRLGEVFGLGGRTAFVIEPPTASRQPGPRPWVWYAPVRPRTPAVEELWMFDQLLEAGVAIAGIDVGESYGSPAGIRGFEELYGKLTGEWGFAKRPTLLARSRGGLMLYGWATLYPDCVAGVAGIYPVCDLTSYPGIERAAPAFGLSAEELRAEITIHNPILRLSGLASAAVPVLHIHGDQDTVVPLDANSAALADVYGVLGGTANVLVQEGRGHDMWSGWFQSKPLVTFMIERSLAGAEVESGD